jgi:hypothetical protein
MDIKILQPILIKAGGIILKGEDRGSTKTIAEPPVADNIDVSLQVCIENKCVC